MDTKTESESNETIEQILRFSECDSSILVKMIVEMAGSGAGDNYMSVVKRLIVSGTHDKNQNQNGMYSTGGFSCFIILLNFFLRLHNNSKSTIN